MESHLPRPVASLAGLEASGSLSLGHILSNIYDLAWVSCLVYGQHPHIPTVGVGLLPMLP